jgi:hypothetical protein
MLLKEIAKNCCHPEVLIVLLTNVQRKLLICNAVCGEVIASTLIENHKNTKIANIVLEKQNVWLNVVMM